MCFHCGKKYKDEFWKYTPQAETISDARYLSDTQKRHVPNALVNDQTL